MGLGPVYGRLVLLLTTRGRKTGKPRITPLQYEEVGNQIVVASGRGTRADWYRNIVADPNVEVRVRRKRFAGVAVTSTDPAEIASFLELRLERHPRMVGRIMKMRGVPADPSEEDLEAYGRGVAMVTIMPRST